MPLTRHRRVRGALLAALLVGLVLLAWQRPNPFADRVEVRVLVPDAGQVAPVGADVRMAGTPVGRITGRRRVGDDAELTLELRREAGTIRADATATLRPRLPFEGTAYLELRPGTAAAPPLGDRVLPVTQTAVATSLDDVLRLADAPTRRALQGTTGALAGALDGPDAVRATPGGTSSAAAPSARTPSGAAPSASGAAPSAAAPSARTPSGAAPSASGAEALRRALRRAPDLLRDGAWSAEALTRDPDALRRAVRGLSRTAGAVARREADLAPLAAGTARSARALRGGGTLRPAVRELAPAATAVRDGSRALDRTLTKLEPLARDLRPALRALSPALADARPLLREAAPALTRATPLLADARAAVDAGAAATPVTRRVLADLDPALGTLDATLVPALLRETSIGVPAYVAFLNLFGGGGAASRPFAPAGDPSGAGHVMRFGFRFLTGVGLPAPPCSLLERANAQLAAAVSKAGVCTP